MKKKITPQLQTLKRFAPKRPRRKQSPEESLGQAIKGLPRITNETVAEHREEVLSSARKYIYPLQHSAHRVVVVSLSLVSAGVVLFFMFCILSLYYFHATSGFIYDVTKVIPFPVAKAGPHFISYESYLFELRHYMHYYQTQQQINFSDASGKRQLDAFRKQTLQAVVQDAYVKQLASQNHISVSSQEVDDELALVRSQNRLGSSDQVFADVLKEFWGWSVDDFKRELKQQLLAQKVVSALDIGTHERAQNVLNQLQHGADFATLAAQNSDDLSTRASGGQYGFAVDRANRDLAPQVVQELFKLHAGQTSGVIDTGSGLEIVKVDEVNGSQVRASHILFNFKPLNTYTDPLRAKEKPHYYISQ